MRTTWQATPTVNRSEPKELNELDQPNPKRESESIAKHESSPKKPETQRWQYQCAD